MEDPCSFLPGDDWGGALQAPGSSGVPDAPADSIGTSGLAACLLQEGVSCSELSVALAGARRAEILEEVPVQADDQHVCPAALCDAGVAQNTELSPIATGPKETLAQGGRDTPRRTVGRQCQDVKRRDVGDSWRTEQAWQRRSSSTKTFWRWLLDSLIVLCGGRKP